MEGVGFLIHQNKSVLVPTQDIGFLDNRTNSIEMIVYLPDDKKHLIILACSELSRGSVAKICEVARVVGLMVSTFSAVEYGPLYYRELEKEKKVALKQNQGNFEAYMKITKPTKVTVVD